MLKYESVDDIPDKISIEERCKYMRRKNIIVDVLEYWLKKRNIKTTDYDRMGYQKIAWNILDALEHKKLT